MNGDKKLPKHDDKSDENALLGDEYSDENKENSNQSDCDIVAPSDEEELIGKVNVGILWR